MNAQATHTTRDVEQQLEATSRAVLAADSAYLREATDSVHWERRGWLGRLVRRERTPERIDRQPERGSRAGERRVA
jgi:hypothetical protein